MPEEPPSDQIGAPHLTVYRMARFVRELRKREEYDQGQAAVELGIDVQKYRRIEEGSEPFPPEKLPDLARVYRIPEPQRLFEIGAMAYGMAEAVRRDHLNVGDEQDLGIADYGRLRSPLNVPPRFDLPFPKTLKARGDYRRFLQAEDPSQREVRQLRAATGLTAREFASLIDVPLPTLRMWEYGRTKPSGDRLAALRAACAKYLLVE